MTDRTRQAINDIKQQKKQRRWKHRDSFYYNERGSGVRRKIKGRKHGGFGVADNMIIHLRTGTVLVCSDTRTNSELHNIAGLLNHNDIGGRYSNLGDPDKGTFSVEEWEELKRGMQAAVEVK